MRLEGLILAGTFRWKNVRHRQLLQEDDAPLNLAGHAHALQLEQFVDSYRRQSGNGTRAHLAQWVERLSGDADGTTYYVHKG